MDLLMAGVTGGTGKLALERALDAGHRVVAVARRPEAVAEIGRASCRERVL